MKLSFEYLLPAAGHEAGRELYSLQMITLLSYTYKVPSMEGLLRAYREAKPGGVC